ncbi:hypothetical protein M408DRAFT_333655 [Serendipita vermifera MAFF 305830]|uniref:Uncharacterized protein n=1 Tax=Serendipita vermifera MAFF 305830 TaxID=933852 RepID=A0A0C3A930_SERVB|nr:hypothetical protein M408DRAFT_333655 [Serendipita vermifera MAFF 305830]
MELVLPELGMPRPGMSSTWKGTISIDTKLIDEHKKNMEPRRLSTVLGVRSLAYSILWSFGGRPLDMASHVLW